MMKGEAGPRVLVVGIGNDQRGDDAVGLVATRRLKGLALPGVQATEQRGDLLGLLDRWRDMALVILIDAVVSGARPGTVHRLEVSHGPLPGAFNGLSTHSLGLPETVALARELGNFPKRLVVYGIEGKSCGMGEGLSPEVEGALDAVQAMVLEEIGCTSWD